MKVPFYSDIKKAKKIMKEAKEINNKSVKKVKSLSKSTENKLGKLRKYEIDIQDSFKSFSKLFEKIKNKPEFKDIKIGEYKIPKYEPKKIIKVSIKAEAIKSSLKGAGAGGITALAGVILSAPLPGIGFLAAIPFILTGAKHARRKAEKALKQAKANEAKAEKICEYLGEISSTADSFKSSLKKVNAEYVKHLRKLSELVNKKGKKDYNKFTEKEKTDLENTVLLVIMLYEMCGVKLVKKADKKNEPGKINYDRVKKAKKDAHDLLKEVA